MGPKKCPAPFTVRLNQSIVWFASNHEPSGRQCCCMAPRLSASLRYIVGKTTMVATSSIVPEAVMKYISEPSRPMNARRRIHPTRLKFSRIQLWIAFSGIEVRKVRPTDMPTVDSSHAYSLCRSMTAAASTPATLMARAVVIVMLPKMTMRCCPVVSSNPSSRRVPAGASGICGESEDELCGGILCVGAGEPLGDGSGVVDFM
mmetsp:Transcript_49663/g.115135  ORF Transcript_49663/g.115135 Transcript_49663/m.115135 type:complete len:203 (+) Transcript_49663:269-877(+)